MNNESKTMKISYKAVIGWGLIIIGFIMLCNSIRLCFSADIWYDELFTVGMAKHSYGEFIRFTAKDVHPPLYYCIVKAVLDLCKLITPSADTIVIIKIVSVIPYFLLLIYAVTFMRKRFGIFVAGVFFFCIMSMPQMSAYTVEMRMYGFALFFVTAAFLHVYEIVSGYKQTQASVTVSVSEPKPVSGAFVSGVIPHSGRFLYHYTAFTLYGLAAAYTQYFACVAVIMIYACLFVWFGICLWKKKEKDAGNVLKNLLFCVLASVIVYLPWFFVLLSQISTVRANYWILPLTWRSLGGCVKFLMKPAFTDERLNTILAIVMFLTYITLPICFAFHLWKTKKAQKVCREKRNFFFAAAGCLVLCGLVGFGFAASFIIRPVFVYRYMLPAMGCFWLCFALCLDACMDFCGWFFYRIPGVFALLLIVAVGIRDYRAFMGEEEYKIVLMKETEAALSDIASEDIIIYNFDQLQAVTGYYMEQESYLWNGEAEALIVEIFGDKGSVYDTQQIKEWLQNGKNIWFFGSFNSREDIRTEWEAEGIMTQENGSYLLERYWFNIYELSLKSERNTE